MTATNYVPFSQMQLNEVLIQEMGFAPIDMSGAWEHVYERKVVTKSGVEYPYRIRVWTSVDKSTNWTRDCGEDSIKIQLIDEVVKRPVTGVKFSRVHRTKNALSNLRKRARSAFKTVLEAPKCPTCGSIMVVRKNKKTGHQFLSCSHYAPGKDYHCTTTSPLVGEVS